VNFSLVKATVRSYVVPILSYPRLKCLGARLDMIKFTAPIESKVQAANRLALHWFNQRLKTKPLGFVSSIVFILSYFF
jgi:hypothetical protein